ncbi:MAG: hypothetical protein LUD47_01340 [Clostridia bacterium]|nr:hypothetical protein [Clostridia bacterium]
MKCSKCGANFKKALELVNGDIVCPACFKSLTPGEDEFRLDSDEWFGLSRTYYLSYLELAARQGEENVRERAQREKKMNDYLARALDYCERAAADYHPEALVDMGYYYYKNYEKYDVGGIGRFRIAYTYFRCIIDGKNHDNLYKAYSDFYSQNGDKAASENGRKKMFEVIRKAAYYLKDMYSCAPAEFSANRKGNLYGVANTNRMLDEQLKGLGDLGREYKITEADTAYTGESAKVEAVKATLKRCTEKAAPHPPIFGYYEISRSEYDEISRFVEENIKRSEQSSFARFLVTEKSGGFDVCAYDREDEAYRGAKRVFLCFYNRNCVSKILKKELGNPKGIDTAIGRTEKMFFNQEDDDLKNIVKYASEAGKSESCIFYIDDVYFVSGHIMKKAGKPSLGEGFLSFLDESYKQ